MQQEKLTPVLQDEVLPFVAGNPAISSVLYILHGCELTSMKQN